MADDSPSLLGIIHGKPDKQKLFFKPCDDENPTNTSHEISEHVLFRYLLNDYANPFIKEKFKTFKLSPIPREIDPESKIVQVETHCRSGKPVQNGSYYIFLVFKTVSEKDGEFWWSLKETAKHAVILQRSRDRDSVMNKFEETFAEELEGKGCMRELLTLLWIHMIVDVKYHRNWSRCKSVGMMVVQKITKIRYEYENDFNYSSLSAEERNPDLLEIINFLLNVSNWHPLVVATYLGDTVLLDRVQQDGQYNINGVYHNFTLLNVAILFAKTKMVQHLLGKLKAHPLRCDDKGRNALHTAAKFSNETEIINSLLKNEKIAIDQCDATGTTALNHAIRAANTTAVRYLLDNGADPKKMDQIGRWPLHVAASYASDAKIIDLFLIKKRVIDINEGNKSGETALHMAAKASNVTTARHLLAKGADINRRDKEGLTPLLLAAKFAKDMDLIDLFLDNKKVDLHYCDTFGQNVIDYAEQNTYGLGQEIIDRVEDMDEVVMKEYNVLKLATSELHIPTWKSLVWDLHEYLGSIIPSDTWLEPLFEFLIAYSPVSTKNVKWKLFYVPFADLRPGKGIEISGTDFIRNEESLNRFGIISAESESLNIFGDIAHDCEYAQLHFYESDSNSTTNWIKTSTVFALFETTSQTDGERWWSVDVNADSFVVQRSRRKDAVKNKFAGKERKEVTHATSINMEARGSIQNCLALLWALHIMQEKSQVNRIKAKSFSRITYFSEMEDWKADATKEFLDQNHVFFGLVNILRSAPNQTRLFIPICSGNAELLDQYVEDFEIDGDEINGALHLAIAFPNQTEMVRHLLENYNADPTFRDASGRNALEMAAIHADNTEIIDLILKHESVQLDGRNEYGNTALHFAAHSSNLVAARHFINRGAKPNLFDHNGGLSPLHLAAGHCDDTEMMDILLKALKTHQVDEGIDLSDHASSAGITALQYAAIASNEITAKHLLKRGADPNRKDNFGRTALHFAANCAKDMDIVEVFLNDKKVDVDSLDNSQRNVFYYAEGNEHGLIEEIVDRLNAPRHPAKSRRPLIFFLLVFILGFFVLDSLIISIGLCLVMVFLFYMFKI